MTVIVLVGNSKLSLSWRTPSSKCSFELYRGALLYSGSVHWLLMSDTEWPWVSLRYLQVATFHDQHSWNATQCYDFCISGTGTFLQDLVYTAPNLGITLRTLSSGSRFWPFFDFRHCHLTKFLFLCFFISVSSCLIKVKIGRAVNTIEFDAMPLW